VVRHGNEVGLSREALEALPPQERQDRIAAAAGRLAANGPRRHRAPAQAHNSAAIAAHMRQMSATLRDL